MQVMLEATVMPQTLHLAQVTNNFRNRYGSFFSEKSSIIFVVGKSPMDIMELFYCRKKSHIIYNEKQQNHH